MFYPRVQKLLDHRNVWNTYAEDMKTAALDEQYALTKDMESLMNRLSAQAKNQFRDRSREQSVTTPQIRVILTYALVPHCVISVC